MGLSGVALRFGLAIFSYSLIEISLHESRMDLAINPISQSLNSFAESSSFENIFEKGLKWLVSS